VLKKITRLRILTAQPIEMRFNEMLEVTKAETVGEDFGNDYDVSEKLPDRSKTFWEKTPERRKWNLRPRETPQLQINTKRNAPALRLAGE